VLMRALCIVFGHRDVLVFRRWWMCARCRDLVHGPQWWWN
jgi:hypothetical protein